MEKFCKKTVRPDAGTCCKRIKIVVPAAGSKAIVDYYQFHGEPDRKIQHEYKPLKCDMNVYEYYRLASEEYIFSEEEFKQLKDKIRTIYEKLLKKREEENCISILKIALENKGIDLNITNGFLLDDESMVILCDGSEYQKAKLNRLFPKGGVI